MQRGARVCQNTPGMEDEEQVPGGGGGRDMYATDQPTIPPWRSARNSRDSPRCRPMSCYWRFILITYTTPMGCTWTRAWSMRPSGNSAGGGWPISQPADMPCRRGPLEGSSPRAWMRNGGGFMTGAVTSSDLLSLRT